MKTVKIVKSIIVATSIFIGSVSFAQNNAGDMVNLAGAIKNQLDPKTPQKASVDPRTKTEAGVSKSPFSDYRSNKRIADSRKMNPIVKKREKKSSHSCPESMSLEDCKLEKVK